MLLSILVPTHGLILTGWRKICSQTADLSFPFALKMPRVSRLEEDDRTKCSAKNEALLLKGSLE